jgi:hypothetical protein
VNAGISGADAGDVITLEKKAIAGSGKNETDQLLS